MAQQEWEAIIEEINTNLIKLEQALRGFPKGRMTLIASRSSHAKTLLSLEITNYIASKNTQFSILFFSLGHINNTILKEKLTAPNSLMKFIEKQSSRIDEIINICEEEKSRDGLALVVIGDLQFITGDKSLPIQLQASEDCRNLAAIAKALDCHVVLNSQLPIKTLLGHEETGRPNLADLRRVGLIDADPDAILLIHQCENEINNSEIIILKNRLGEVTNITWSLCK